MFFELLKKIGQAEVAAAKTMIERTEQRFDIKPERLVVDTAYGSGASELVAAHAQRAAR